MANNAIPDSVIMKMICRSLVPPVVPKVRSTEVALTSKNTLRILNTINPVARALTAMVAVIAVKNTWFVQAVPQNDIDDVIQVTRGDKLKSAYQMKID